MGMTDLVAAKISAVTAVVTAASAGALFALTDAVAISAITSSAALCMTVVTAYFAHKAKVSAEESKAVAKETHSAVNSRLEKLMELVEQKFFAAGKLEGTKEAKVISDAADKARTETIKDLKNPPNVP